MPNVKKLSVAIAFLAYATPVLAENNPVTRSELPTAEERTVNRSLEEQKQIRASFQSSVSEAAKDREFLVRSARSGVAEEKLGRLGVRNASSETVKEFARMIETGHRDINDKLRELVADRKWAPLPDRPEQIHVGTYARLERMSGPGFDREFMRVTIEDHKKMIEHFEEQERTAKNHDVRQFASETLPALRRHLAEAERVNREL